MTLPPIVIANQDQLWGRRRNELCHKICAKNVLSSSHESYSLGRPTCMLLMTRSFPFLGVCSLLLTSAHILPGTPLYSSKHTPSCNSVEAFSKLLNSGLKFPQKQHRLLCQLIFPACGCRAELSCGPVSKVHLLTHFPWSTN